MFLSFERLNINNCTYFEKPTSNMYFGSLYGREKKLRQICKSTPILINISKISFKILQKNGFNVKKIYFSKLYLMSFTVWHKPISHKCALTCFYINKNLQNTGFVIFYFTVVAKQLNRS